MPRLLDLFCCAGGAAAGYAAAGFDVVGVDIADHGAAYPFGFVRGDALAYVADHGHEFDAIHASPPCQAFTSLRTMPTARPHPDLVAPTRAALTATGRPWVIENVVGAPLVNPVMLCGSMFGLSTVCADGIRRGLRRHRLFETSPAVDLWPPFTCDHALPVIGVYGGAGGAATNGAYQANVAESAAVLGIGWMRKRELTQAIPPAYTAHVGAALLAACAATVGR